MIARDGKVLQVRIGDVVLRVVAGALWTIPLKAGSAGEAKINRADVSADARGTLSWKAVASDNNRVQIVAEVSYRSFTIGTTLNATSSVGKWTAIYSERSLPESFNADIRGGGNYGVINVLAVNLQPR